MSDLGGIELYDELDNYYQNNAELQNGINGTAVGPPGGPASPTRPVIMRNGRNSRPVSSSSAGSPRSPNAVSSPPKEFFNGPPGYPTGPPPTLPQRDIPSPYRGSGAPPTSPKPRPDVRNHFYGNFPLDKLQNQNGQHGATKDSDRVMKEPLYGGKALLAGIEQYEELRQKLEEREKQIVQLQQVLEPVCDEYNELEMKLKIEQGCRNKAEEYAGKVVKQNKKLKRQSMQLRQQVQTAGLSAVDINIEEMEDPYDTISMISEASTTIPEQQDHFNSIIEDLQDQVVKLQQQLNKAEDEKERALEKEQEMTLQYQQEHEMLQRTQTNLHHYEQQLKQFKRVSMNALDEYQDLHRKYEMQRKLNNEAEKFATTMLSERDAVVRESSILIASAASDERLAASLMEIEKLNKELELERQNHRHKVQELEEVIQASHDLKQTNDLENRLQAAVEQIESLQQQLKDSNQWSEKLQGEVGELTSKLQVAEDKLKPPPPPMPPPLPPDGLFKPLKFLLQKKESVKEGDAKKKTGKPVNQQYEKAVNEMMERIKGGVTLRRAKLGNKRSQTPADMTGEQSMEDAEGEISLEAADTYDIYDRPSSVTSVRHSYENVPSLPELSTMSSTEKAEATEGAAFTELHRMLVSIKRESPSPAMREQMMNNSSSSEQKENELMTVFARIRGNQKLSNIEEEEESLSNKTNDEKRDSGEILQGPPKVKNKPVARPVTIRSEPESKPAQSPPKVKVKPVARPVNVQPATYSVRM